MLILHRINDIVLSQSAYGIATMLKNLYGNTVMNNVMICATMWDTVTEDEGGDLLDELCTTGAWGAMLSMGAGTAKIANVCSNAKEEAEKILTQLIKNAQPVELAIQDDMDHQKPEVTETGVGKILDEGFRDLQTDAELEMEEIQMRTRQESETITTKAQELIRGREVEEAMLKGESEEKAHERKEQVEELQQRRERMGEKEEANSTKTPIVQATLTQQHVINKVKPP